jgi:Secretion system C-terminal sorting domain
VLALAISDTTNAIASAVNILPQCLRSSNHIAVLGIRLNGERIDNLEMQQLLSIATQCEDLGGKAVNIARSVLATQGVYIWDDTGCQGASKYGNAPSAEGATVMVSAECYPNPTAGAITVRFGQHHPEGIIKVYDALGKLAISQPISLNSETVELDASESSQGILLVVAELTDGTRFSWRIILQR